MKRFIDYKLTKDEIYQMYENDEDYRETLADLDESPGSDFEKYQIARLLFIRGQREDARETLETMKDERYRWTCLNEYYPMWEAWEDDCV